jgi:type IV secretory pathway VirB4 component
MPTDQNPNKPNTKLNPKEQAEKARYLQGQNTLKDLIAPASLYVDPKTVRIGSQYARTIFVMTYPRYLTTGWFAPIINLDYVMDISMFMYPLDSAHILKALRTQVTRFQAQMMRAEEKGLIRDPVLETAYRDAETLRDELQQGTEKFFQFGLYITLYSDSVEMLEKIVTQVDSILQTKMVYSKPCFFQTEQGFKSTLPILKDELQVSNNLNTAPLSTTFPFISANISSNQGILYGINRHNNSLILFDRFAMENANEVFFAKSGGGKSYLAKLEILRHLMLGVEVIVIDPENEYSYLTEAVDGTFIKISLTSHQHINPFDLPPQTKDEDPSDLLKTNIAELLAMLKLMLEGDKVEDQLTAKEEAILDLALYETYASKDIVMGQNYAGKPVPTLSDLENVLKNMEGGEDLAIRLSQYTYGTFSGFINQPTNITMDKNLIVFNTRDMESVLQPLAMFVVTHYIWKDIRRELKKRILVVDEAWVMMKQENAAAFLFSIAKRARKYYLGMTTITQDIADFLSSEYGKAILTNSSIQVLLKQSPASIDIIKDTFYLTDEEKFLLLESDVGEGIFFAGLKHAAIKVVASYSEDQVITSDPAQLLKIQAAKNELREQQESGRQVDPFSLKL